MKSQKLRAKLGIYSVSPPVSLRSTAPSSEGAEVAQHFLQSHAPCGVRFLLEKMERQGQTVFAHPETFSTFFRLTQ